MNPLTQALDRLQKRVDHFMEVKRENRARMQVDAEELGKLLQAVRVMEKGLRDGSTHRCTHMSRDECDCASEIEVILIEALATVNAPFGEGK